METRNLPCPFCGGPAREPFTYNGTLETGCAGDHECPGTDVLVPLAAWNRRAENDKIDGLEADLHEAVRVAFKRGAREWARLNYREWYEHFLAEELAMRDDCRTVEVRPEPPAHD